MLHKSCCCLVSTCSQLSVYLTYSIEQYYHMKQHPCAHSRQHLIPNNPSRCYKVDSTTTVPLRQQQSFSLQHRGRHPFPSRKQLCATPPNSSAPTKVLYCKPMEPRSNGTKRKAQQQFSHVPYDCCCSKNSSLSSSPMYRKQLFCTNTSSYTYLGVHANSTTWRPNHSQQRSAGSN